MELNSKIENSDFSEESPKMEAVDVVVEEGLFSLESKIIRQLEYYFSNTNLPFNKLLLNEFKADGGWVKISILLTFKRLASLSKDPAVISAAVKNCDHHFLEIDESDAKIRRKPASLISVTDQTFTNEWIERSIYCKVFPNTATMDELIDFAASFDDIIITDIINNINLKTSHYLTFNTKIQAEDFLKQGSVKYRGVELKHMWKKEYVARIAKEDEKIKAETDIFFEKGYLLKAEYLNDTETSDSITNVCSSFKWQIDYVKIVEDQKIAWIKLKHVKVAKDLLKEIADKMNELNLKFSIPEEETEQIVLNEISKYMKIVLNMENIMQNNKNIVENLHNNKRKNHYDYSKNKGLKTNGK